MQESNLPVDDPTLATAEKAEAIRQASMDWTARRMEGVMEIVRRLEARGLAELGFPPNTHQDDKSNQDT